MSQGELRVAVVMPLATRRGGAEVALTELLSCTADRAIAWLVVFLEDGPMVSEVARPGVQTEVLAAGRLRDAGRWARTVWQIAGLARRHRSRVLLSWMAKGQLYGGVAAVLAGVPGAWYQVGLPSPPSWLERMATTVPARRVLACSGAGAAAQARVRPRRRVGAVYPGVATDRFDPDSLPDPPEARRRLGLDPQRRLIGTVGRLQRWKGMHLLVQAMPAILEGHPDLGCVVVGEPQASEPEYRSSLEDMVGHLGLEDHVDILVQRSTPLWFQAMDVMVHVSQNEPFGIAVVEAMALGKPVVAGDAGGPAEVIVDGRNGLLVPFGDPPALARAVRRLLDDHELAVRIGREARSRSREFSSDRCAASFERALRDLAAEPSRAGGQAGRRVP